MPPTGVTHALTVPFLSSTATNLVVVRTSLLQIFSLLFQAKGQPLSREEVKVKVWGDVNVSPKTFDVHLFHLRKKLRALGIEIRFNPLGGYFLSKTTAPADDYLKIT